MKTITATIRITVDEDNIDALYPNYSINWNTPEEFMNHILDYIEETNNNVSIDSSENKLKKWGYTIEVLKREEAKVIDLDLDSEEEEPMETILSKDSSMDINAKEGTLVRFTGKGGYDYDREKANRHLAVGSVYTVDKVDIDPWSSVVYLKETPKICFNSVMFIEDKYYKP